MNVKKIDLFGADSSKIKSNLVYTDDFIKRIKKFYPDDEELQQLVEMGI